MLAHEPYFDVLNTIKNTTAEWRSTLAGLLVLRLIDSWLDNDSVLVVRDVVSTQAVRETLAGVRERDPVLSLLCDLVDLVTQSERSSVSSIASPMLAYGRMLHFTNQWKLALDVFASLLSHALAVQDDLTIERAATRLAFVLKHLGHLDASDNAYAIALQAALRLDRLELRLKIHMGISRNLALRGQVLKAEAILKTVATEASARELTNIQGITLQDLSSLAILRGNYRTAIRVGQTALGYLSRPIERDRLLVNLGAAFVGYGDHHTAKNILHPLLARIQEDSIRQTIFVNLLEIAAKDTDRSTFDKYRYELDGRLTLPDLQAHYYLYVAKGQHLFGNMATAKTAWQNALEITTVHGLRQMHKIITEEMAAARR